MTGTAKTRARHSISEENADILMDGKMQLGVERLSCYVMQGSRSRPTNSFVLEDPGAYFHSFKRWQLPTNKACARAPPAPRGSCEDDGAGRGRACRVITASCPPALPPPVTGDRQALPGASTRGSQGTVVRGRTGTTRTDLPGSRRRHRALRCRCGANGAHSTRGAQDKKVATRSVTQA
jgi:hypothetical protein